MALYKVFPKLLPSNEFHPGVYRLKMSVIYNMLSVATFQFKHLNTISIDGAETETTFYFVLTCHPFDGSVKSFC